MNPRKMNVPASPPPLDFHERAGYITRKRRYSLLTPLFGGGVEAGVPDPITVVRGAAVRGHLRFWWRACRGGSYGSLKEMKEAEGRIWGSAAGDTGGASQVSLRIALESRGMEEYPYEAKDWRTLAYAAFPLQPEDGKLPGRVLRGVRFTLHLIYPEQHARDIDTALWAWETFGGIGARTRRGFGALCLESVDGETPERPADNVKEWLTAALQRHVTEGPWRDELARVPHLHRDMRLQVTGAEGPWKAWEKLIQCLYKFRQKRRGRYGRSCWPEPDAIREVTGRSTPGHAKAVTKVRKFPRAAFGLPIVFHFKDDADPQSTLYGHMEQDGPVNRWASPLILRPMKLRNGQAVGLAAVLKPDRTPHEETLTLKESNDTLHTVSAKLTEDEAKQLQMLDNATDVIDAFLGTLH